jgi:lipopolysaccharide assembly outer membrane protein LptD (OstA)
VNGPTTELRGNVEITNSDFAIHADQAIHHGDTGELEAHGNVRLMSIKGDVKAKDLRISLRSGDVWALVDPPATSF